MVYSFKIKLNMTSDWHIGSGTGRGDIDSLVQLDQDDLPYIPAKTLTGILRDSCEIVALGLDNGQDGGMWQQWVDYLFGDQPALERTAVEAAPRPAALSIRSAHLPEALKKALNSQSKLKKAITFIKPETRIDSFSGCADDQSLRFLEMVRCGTTLETQECQLSLPTSATEAQKKTALALLIAAAKMTTRIGGKRRRGAGLCEVAVELPPNLQTSLQFLSEQENPPALPESSEVDNLNIQPVTNTTISEWYTLDFNITAKTPIVINSRTVGNVVETLDYLPGKYFLPILHKKLGQWLDISQAIAQSDLIVTHATIKVDNQAGRPTPFCLFADKVKGGLDKGLVYNRLTEPEPNETQLKGIRGGYLGKFAQNHLPNHQKIDTIIYTHNTIQDEVQRPTDQVGGIYSYEAIPSGTTFRAQLRLKKALVDRLKQRGTKLWEKLNGDHRLGQSKKDDYGLIALNVVSPPQQLPQATINPSTTTLSVWLLSDLLMRDQRLRPTADLEQLRKELETALGVQLKARENEELVSLMARQFRTDSWQFRWGLARPSLVGLQAGSCAVYEVTGTLNAATISKIQAEGIGERRTEGYGQVCFNDPLLTQKMSHLQPPSRQRTNPVGNTPALKKNNSAFAYAEIIETAAWREAIQRQALGLAENPTNRQEILGIKISGGESNPPMTQLGGFKSQILQLQSQEDTNTELILKWIENILKVESRKEKWPDDSLPKIEKLIEDKSLIWTHLDIPNDLTLTDNAQQNLKQKLWAEAIRTLVNACIRAHKRTLEHQQSTQE